MCDRVQVCRGEVRVGDVMGDSTIFQKLLIYYFTNVNRSFTIEIESVNISSSAIKNVVRTSSSLLN